MNQAQIPTSVLYLLQTLHQKGFQAYIVGGAVRDLLLKLDQVVDWDITTNATPDQIMLLFPGSFYDNNFGTVMIAPKHVYQLMNTDDPEINLDVFDITTYRTESGYTDKRRPDKVDWGISLSEDLIRRDFTINALALKINTNNLRLSDSAFQNTDFETIDQFDGIKDLENKIIRTVGNPHERFQEDALRMMRAIRFGAQLGFQIEPDTLSAIQKDADLLSHVSWERIRDELFKILASPYPADGILLLQSSGLLQYIIPELLEAKNIKQGGHHIYDVWTHSIESLRHCPSTDPLVRFATLLHDIGKPKTAKKQGPRGVTFYGHEVVGAHMTKDIANRLRLSNKQKNKLFTLVRWHMFHYQPEMTDSAIRRFIRRVGRDQINDMMMLRVGDRKGGGSKATSWRLRELQKRIGENLYEPLSVRDLNINGHDLMEKFDLKPSPILGQLLNQIFEEVMEGDLKNDKKTLIKRASQILKTTSSA